MAVAGQQVPPFPAPQGSYLVNNVTDYIADLHEMHYVNC